MTDLGKAAYEAYCATRAPNKVLLPQWQDLRPERLQVRPVRQAPAQRALVREVAGAEAPPALPLLRLLSHIPSRPGSRTQAPDRG